MDPFTIAALVGAKHLYRNFKRGREKVCKDCAKQVNKGDRFCKSCGGDKIVSRKELKKSELEERRKQRPEEVSEREKAKARKARKREEERDRRLRECERETKRRNTRARMKRALHCSECGVEYEDAISSWFFSKSHDRTFCSACGSKVREYTESEINAALRKI